MVVEYVGMCLVLNTEGVQEQIEEARESTRKWRVTANTKIMRSSCCNEDQVKSTHFKWKLGEHEFPIVDQ